MIEIKMRNGDSFFIQVALIESILEREGNTSEIVTTTGNRYNSIWSKEKIAEKINSFVFRSTSDASGE
jgi:hypothetical protein